ncbi:MAG: LCP family protein [Clostridia bacterium]
MSKTKKKLPVWLKVTILLIVAVILFIAGRFLYTTFIDPMGAFDAPSTPSPVVTAGPIVPTPAPTLSPEEQLKADEDQLKADADMDFMKNRVNILMLGWDQSPERDDAGNVMYRDEDNNFRSDVIMLMTLDFEKKTCDLISVPRDTLAPIYKSDGELYSSTAHYKINAAFAKGGSTDGDGFGYARTTIGKLLQVPIDYYVGVDMTGLKAVVDAMGGVDYDVDVRIVLNGRVLEKGMQHLNGQQVLDYCRARKGISTDVGRNDRQQRILFAIFEQLKSRKQLANFPNIYLSLKDYINTNLDFKQISALCVFGLDLDMQNMRRHTLEGEYVNNTAYSNASYYALKNDELAAMMKDIFGTTITTDNRYDVAYVLADKSAGIALDYVKASYYIMDMLGIEYSGYSSFEVDELLSAIDEVKSVAERKLPDSLSDDEKYQRLQTPLDKTACDAAGERIRNALLTLCTNYGVTQLHVDKKIVPKELYTLLPSGTWETE